jgi:hypothetical protein
LRERSAIELLQPPINHLLAFGREEGLVVARLNLADLLRQLRPLVQQLQQLLVNLVDALAQFRQFPHSCSP